MTNDNISHPKHYTNGNIETIDYIHDQLTDDEWRGYIKGNILKYISRERHKGQLEDMRKALWYLNKYVESKNTNVTANIADALTLLNTKPTELSGTIVQSPSQPEQKLNLKSEETTTDTKELDQRAVQAIEEQNRLIASLLQQNDSMIELKKQELSIHASQKFHTIAGDTATIDSTVRRA